MKSIIFSLFGHEKLIKTIAKQKNYEVGQLKLHFFPDEETMVQIRSKVKNRKVIFFANLVQPNNKILPLLYAAKTAATLGAKSITLVTPYLPYMRQDKQFKPGDGVSALYFAELLSPYFDRLVTVDPHLHRIKKLTEIYAIPTKVLHASDAIFNWVKHHVPYPVLIGPDSESEQWIQAIAKKEKIPSLVLKKTRYADDKVKIQLSKYEAYLQHTPVLIDDIISTAKTMITTIEELKKVSMKPPICIGIHAVFAGNAYADLKKAGAKKIISCNTIEHVSNAIDLSNLIANAL